MERDNSVTNCRTDNHYGDYLQCVFNDLEFKRKLKVIEDLIEKFLLENPGKVFVGTFHHDCEPKEAKGLVEELALEFDISPSDIDELFIFSKDTYYFSMSKPHLYPDVAGNQIIVRLWPNTTKQELLELWPAIEIQQKEMGKRNHRRKEPEYIDMLYAIHRARKKGMKYAEISDLLWDGKLPGYNKQNQYSKEIIKSYYSKFRKMYLLSD